MAMMMELNDGELTLLAGMLRADLDEMTREIAHTDSRAYREALQRRRTMVEQILGKLERVDEGIHAGA